MPEAATPANRVVSPGSTNSQEPSKSFGMRITKSSEDTDVHLRGANRGQKPCESTKTCDSERDWIEDPTWPFPGCYRSGHASSADS
jgi:hypothetical protein